MNQYNIGIHLKQLRKLSGYSVKEVVKQLEFYNIHIATKTLYGYERNTTMPNAYTFIVLCQIYNCENPITMFDFPSVDSKEITMLKKYRKLDDNGKEIIDFVLNLEIKRTQELQLLKEKYTDKSNI